MEWSGIILGASAFLIIGLFHPIVIKAEYYWGKRCWWLFAVAGFVSCIASLLSTGVLSAILGVLGFSCFWSILELFQQEKRVAKGWFPSNPKKGILLILLLPCLFSGSGASRDNDWKRTGEAVIAESTDQAAKDRNADFKDLALLPVRTATYSGDGNSYAPSARSSSGARRVQASSRSAYRIIKAGKIIDQNNFYAFRAVILQFQSGMHSNSRYIHTICHLLI